jgi:hypothetical protein
LTDATDLADGLPDAADLPLPSRPDVPLWVENFWWLAFDEQRAMGVMVHLASLPHDFSLLRQTVLVFMPDGRVLADLSVGGGRSHNRVAGATVSAECLVPFRAWRIALGGMAQATTIDELWRGPLAQGRRLPVRFDLTATSLSPAWNAGGGHGHTAMTEQGWASHHYQQTVAVRGSVEIDGQAYQLDCRGVRDHSRGARDMASWGGHCLLTAPFPKGDAFGIMAVLGADGRPAMNAAYAVIDGCVQRGTVRELPPPLSGDVLETEDFTIEIELATGVQRVSVRTAPQGLQRSILTMLAPNDLVVGLYRDDPHAIALSWVPARYTWNGKTGYGPVERSALADTLTTARSAS